MADKELAKAYTYLFWDVIKDDATAADIRQAGYDAADYAVNAQQEAISDLVEAIRLTVEYTGTDVLPPLPGWSYYDALKKHAPDIAEYFEKQHQRLHGKENTDGTD